MLKLDRAPGAACDGCEELRIPQYQNRRVYSHEKPWEWNDVSMVGKPGLIMLKSAE
jgi:hypothetical protein